MANKTEMEALARNLVQATDNRMQLSDARTTLTEFMPKYVDYLRKKVPNRYKDLTVDSFKIRPRSASMVLYYAAQSKGIEPDAIFIKKNVLDPQMFQQTFYHKMHEVSVENHARYNRMGTELESTLAPYIDSKSMQQIKGMYRPKGIQYDPSNRYPGNQKAADSYKRYQQSVARAGQILNYLNKRRINFRITNDDSGKHPNELVAILPEYDNTKITLMADSPKRVGLVNTWNDQYNFNSSKRYPSMSSDPMKYNAAVLLDTILNPDANIKHVNRFPNYKSHNQQTIFTRDDIKARTKDGKIVTLPPVHFFSTSQSKRLQSMKDFTEKVEEQNDDIGGDLFKQFEAESGIEEDKNFKISSKDREREIASRYKDDWNPIDTPEKVAAERRDHGLFKTIYNQARRMGMHDIVISRNSKGVYKYNYSFINPRTHQKDQGHGIIGGYIKPERDGTFKLKYNGKTKGWSVPGMRAYIAQDGSLRVKPFSEILREKVRKTMVDEFTNPNMNDSAHAYSALDKLYTQDGYSTLLRRKGVNSPAYERALIKTLHRRIRLPDTDLANANALNEDDNHVKQNSQRYQDSPDTKRTEMLAKGDLRTIPKEWQKVVDREMTGIGPTMGATLYIGDDVKINPKTGQLIPKPGVEHTKTALHKRPECQWDKYDPVDRNIMWFNQAVRNVPMKVVNVAYMTMSGYTENDAAVITKKYAENNPQVNEDGSTRPQKIGDKITDAHGNKSTISYIIDPDKTDDLLKETQNDKKAIQDFKAKYGDKSFTQDMRDKFKDLKHKYMTDNLHYKMAAIVKANPDLDVIANPYSSVSRLNTGSIHEMQDRGRMTHLKDASYIGSDGKKHNIDLHHITMGKEIYAVCEGQRVDEKTVAYTDEDYAKGKARKFDQQLAAAAASADLPETLKAIYKNNPNHGWGKFFDDLHMMGYDIDKQHNIGHFDYNRKDAVVIKAPDKDTISRTVRYDARMRHAAAPAGRDDFNEKYNAAVEQAKQTHKPIIMELPEGVYYHNMAGQKTNCVVVPYEHIKEEAKKEELHGKAYGTSNTWKNRVHNIYKVAAGITLSTQKGPDGKKQEVYDPRLASALARNLGQSIVQKDFAHKKNIIKDEIYSRPMRGSSTSVVTPDPTLGLNELEVGPNTWQQMIKADPKLATDRNEVIMGWRNPVLRDGGMRAFHVKMNPDYTGVGINPVNDKSMDMDHDGDTMGLAPINDAKAQKELKKMLPSNNLIDISSQDKSSFLETDLELTGSLVRQGQAEATYVAKKYQKQQGWTNEQTKEFAQQYFYSGKSRASSLNDLQRQDVDGETAQAVINQGFYSNASLGIGLDASTRDSYIKGVENLIASGAKGHCDRDGNGKPAIDKNGLLKSDNIKNLIHYYDGKRTDDDMHNSMVALAVKADVVGPAGASQQKLLWFLRNHNPKPVLDITKKTTDGALQAKHSSEKAKRCEHQIMGPLPNVLSGKKPYSYKYAKNNQLSVSGFNHWLNNIYNIELGMNQSTDEIKSLGASVNDGHGMVMTHQQREDLADPLDALAYDHGSPLTHLNHAIEKGQKLATGKYTKLFEMPDELCSDHVLDHDYNLDKQQTQNQAQEEQQHEQEQEREQEKEQQLEKQAEENKQNQSQIDGDQTITVDDDD